MAKLSKDEQQYVVDEQLELFNYYDKQRASYERMWNTVYKLYNAFVDKKNYPWKSNLFIPLAFQIIENILPRYINGSIFFDYQPKSQEDIDKARAMNLLVNDYQLPNMRFLYKEILWLKQEIIYGTAWAFPRWAIKSRIQPTDKSTKPMFKEKSDIYKPYYQGPEIEIADTFHVWGDARADDETKSTAIIYEDIMDIDYFMQQYAEDLKDNAITREDLEKSWENMKHKYDTLKYDVKGSRNNNSPKCKHVVVMKLFYDNRWVTLANRTNLIMDHENPIFYPGKPVSRLCSIPMKGELYAKTVLDMITSLQFEINDIRNQRIDNVKLSIDRMAIAAKNSSLNQAQMGTAPGKIFWVDEVEEVTTALKFLDMPDVSQSGLFEEDKIYRDFERTTGMTDFQSGVGSVEGATVGSLLEAKLNSKILARTKTLAASGLHTLGQILASLNEQYMKEEVAVRVLGDNGQWSFPDSHKVKPDQLTSVLDLNVEFRPSNEFRKPQILQSMMQLMPYAKTDPNIDMRAYWEEIFNLLEQKNSAGLFVTDDKKKAPASPPIEAHQAREENELISTGQTPKPNQNDNHSLHLMIHNLGLNEAKTPDERDRYRQHIGLHTQYKGGKGYVTEQPEMQGQPEEGQKEIAPDVMEVMNQANQAAQGSGLTNPAEQEGGKRAYTRFGSSNVPEGI